MNKIEMRSKKLRKGLLAITLAFSMFTMTGCNNNNTKESNNTGNTTGKVDEPVKEEKEQFAPGATLLTKEEVQDLINNYEMIVSGKDVSNDVLDQLNADKVYDYKANIYSDAAHKNLVDQNTSGGLSYPQLLSEKEKYQQFGD